MRKFLIALLISIAAACCIGALSACAKEKHVWSEEWKHNNAMHWHECINSGCNERSDEASHEGFWELTERIVHETCLERGWGVYTCSVCGQTKEDIIPDDGGHHFDGAAWYSDGERHWRYCTGWGCNEVEEATHADDDTTVQKIVKSSVSSIADTTIGFFCPVCNYLFHTEIVHSSSMPASFNVVLAAKNSNYPLIPAKGEIEEGFNAEYSVPVGQRYSFAFTSVKNDKGQPLSPQINYNHNELSHRTTLISQTPLAKSGFIVWCDGVEISNSFGGKASEPIQCVQLDDGVGSWYYDKVLTTTKTGDYVIAFTYYAMESELSGQFMFKVKFHVLDEFDYANAKSGAASSAAPSALCIARNLDGVDEYLPVEKHEW